MIDIGRGFVKWQKENSFHFSAGFGSPTEEKSEPASDAQLLAKAPLKRKDQGRKHLTVVF